VHWTVGQPSRTGRGTISGLRPHSFFRAALYGEAEDYAAAGVDDLIIMVASASVSEKLAMLDALAPLTRLTTVAERGAPLRRTPLKYGHACPQ